jgi:DNA-binding NarL/FixJ family response regulator
MIRILLADDQALLCEILRNWLEVEDDIEVVGQANDGKIAIEKVRELHPDIVLIDIEMPVMDGLTATQIISQEFPQVKSIILSGCDDLTYSKKSFEAGAKAYLPKNVAAEELAKTIRSVYQGNYLVQQELIERLQQQELLELEKKFSAKLEAVQSEIVKRESIERLLQEGLRELEMKFFAKLEEVQSQIFLLKEEASHHSDSLLQANQASQELAVNLRVLKKDIDETIRRFKSVGITPENLKLIELFRDQFNTYKPFLHQLDSNIKKTKLNSILTTAIAVSSIIISGASLFYFNQEISAFSSKLRNNASKLNDESSAVKAPNSPGDPDLNLLELPPLY